MTFEVLLRPEAEADIGESYRWYEDQVKGLGEEFLRAVDASISLIQPICVCADSQRCASSISS